MATIRVQTDDFDLSGELALMRARKGAAGIGAVASFIGLVRDVNDGSGVSSLTLEHYPAMTEKALADIVGQAESRWELLDCTLIHRVGPLKPTDQIVLVMVASAHRGHAFAACEFIMDFLKTSAPFWKKEGTPAGERWVDARESDDAATQRWNTTAVKL
jgi:molybdopterin synthase catalytic subunit